jgi:M6 family metalloprotease-like protein
LGSDQIGVWVCDVPLDTTNQVYAVYDHVAVAVGDVAAWAQSTVAPYFAEVSRGRYTTTFTALGHIALSGTDGPGECRNQAIDQTGAPYTNVLFTDTRSYRGGQAGPGRISTNPASDQNVLVAGAPNVTRRGAWVGGGSTGLELSPLVVAHEIGHTLHWPHSYNTSAFEYDNRVDVMSGYPADGLCTRPAPGGAVDLWPCEPQHTLAFNRFATGWIDGPQVAIHRSGTVNYTLDAPTRDGLQFVALPDPSDSRSMLTLEARPRVGRDRFLGVEGVALHVVDQVPRTGGFIDGFSTNRRQRQALVGSGSYAHVVGVGASLTVHGVTVTVLGRTGDSYEVSVSGSYRMPASNFFTDGFGTAVSCATLDITAALERGCRR